MHGVECDDAVNRLLIRYDVERLNLAAFVVCCAYDPSNADIVVILGGDRNGKVALIYSVPLFGNKTFDTIANTPEAVMVEGRFGVFKKNRYHFRSPTLSTNAVQSLNLLLCCCM